MEEKPKITTSNYEAFVISYLDGSLDPVEVAELLLFLEQHPDIREEVAEISSVVLKPTDSSSFGFKELLLQPADMDADILNMGNYELYFIAAHENDLSPKGMEKVRKFIKAHPETEKDFLAYRDARIRSDQTIAFPTAENLKKVAPVAGRRLLYTTLAAAASILILISLFFNIELKPENELAENYQKADTVKEKSRAEVPLQKDVTERTNNKTIATPKVSSKNPGRAGKHVNTENPAKAPAERTQDALKKMPAKRILNNTSEPFQRSYRTFYSSLFDDITRSQETMLASLESDPHEQRGNLPLSNRTGKRIGNFLRNGTHIASNVNESFSGWMLADLGIEGLNLLTDNDLKLQRFVGQDGKTDKIRITESGSGYAIGRNPN